MITCWERAGILALLCAVFSCIFVNFQMWCSGSGVVRVALTPDLCLPIYFYNIDSDEIKCGDNVSRLDNY